MKNKPLQWLMLAILSSLALSGCDGRRVYESYYDFNEASWYVGDSVSFTLEGNETEPTIPVLAIRYSDNYEYHNLYVRFQVSDSSTNVLKDSLVNILLFDPKSGKPLGKGFGNKFTKYDTLMKNGHVPPSAKHVQLVQYMRTDKLEGLESVGLKLINVP